MPRSVVTAGSGLSGNAGLPWPLQQAHSAGGAEAPQDYQQGKKTSPTGTWFAESVCCCGVSLLYGDSSRSWLQKILKWDTAALKVLSSLFFPQIKCHSLVQGLIVVQEEDSPICLFLPQTSPAIQLTFLLSNCAGNRLQTVLLCCH